MYQTHTVEKSIEYACQLQIDKMMMEHHSMPAILARSVTDGVFQLRAMVWGESGSSRHYTFSAPVNWWQALRAAVLNNNRRFDRWILKKWPLKYRVHEIDVKQLYPELGRKINVDGMRNYSLIIDNPVDTFETFTDKPEPIAFKNGPCPVCGHDDE